MAKKNGKQTSNKKDTNSQNLTKPTKEPIIVGIGASAGGLEALQEFFENLPDNPGLTFVIVQHLSPDYKSLMDELLSRHTRMNIYKVEDGQKLEPDSVYLIPPRKNMTIFNGRLFLTDQNVSKGLNLPIDIFLQSLAKDQGKNAVAIILSGTGSDGTLGIRTIKEAGGMVMVQDNRTAKFDGMPRSSISTGLVDYILPPSQMPVELLNYVKHPFISKTKSIEKVIQKEEDSYSKVLAIIRDHVGVDFSSYKNNTILRRLEKRLSINQVSNIEDYVNILLSSPIESRILYKELLIGVTRFFRDNEAFDLIRKKVVPELFKNKKDKDTIRVWSVGCSTGEEPYSLAVIIQEYMEENGIQRDVKIFATDIDRDAIDFAGAGIYPENLINDVDSNLLSKYFIKNDSGYQVTESIRRMVVFAKHNLIKDPPFSKIDFISCRNLFIYLLPEMQKRLLSMFYFSLNNDGFMFLGSSETLGDLTDGFQTINSKWKIYKYKPGAKYNFHENYSINITQQNEDRGYPQDTNLKTREKRMQDILVEQMMDNFVPPTVVLDENYNIVRVINDISKYVRVQPGIFSQNLLKMVPADLAITLNSILRNLQKKKQKLVYNNIAYNIGDRKEKVDIEGLIINNAEEGQRFYSISIIENKAETVKDNSHLEEDSYDLEEQYHDRISELENEVQVTKESLQATVEELETSNEELQSSNEELIASNEELQSTNEELQSVNEELYTVNSEHQSKIEELTQLNNDMNNLLKNINVGTLYLDRKLTIRKFTPLVKDITNIRNNDVGRPVHHISIENTYKNFIKDTEEVLHDLKIKEKEILGPDKNWYAIRMRPYRNDDNAVEGVIVTFININSLKKTLKSLEEERKLLIRILDNSPLGKTMVNKNGHITYANETACKIFNATREELLSREFKDKTWKITSLDGKEIPPDDLPFSTIMKTKKSVYDYKHYVELKDNKKVLLIINGSPMYTGAGNISGAVFTLEDITERNKSSSELRKS